MKESQRKYSSAMGCVAPCRSDTLNPFFNAGYFKRRFIRMKASRKSGAKTAKLSTQSVPPIEAQEPGPMASVTPSPL